MTLRVRLIIGFVTLAVVLAVSTGVVVRLQRTYLVRQLDGQLGAAAPFSDSLVLYFSDPVAYQTMAKSSALAASQLTGMAVGLMKGEGEGPVGATTGDHAPDFSSIQFASAAEVANGRFTVTSVDGTQQFRVGTFAAAGGAYALVALPLNTVEDTTRRLLVMMTITSVLVLLVALALGNWVVQLGLRPIRSITATAGAIAAGRREARVPVPRSSTEAGRLSRAFNQMLDQRDDAERRLQQFVADASHELRTPLTSISGYLDLTLDGEFAPEQLDDMLRRVRSETRRMNDLVEELLLLTNLDGGRALQRTDVDVVRIVHDTASDAHAVQPTRQIDVTAPNHPVVVSGDEMRLQQVVAGLVQNAMVHTPLSARIRLSVLATDRTVEITVDDDGPGLEPGLAASVFDRFVRGDTSRSRHRAGSGLGLSIAKSLVEAHDGRLELDTAPGKGCSFRVVLVRPMASV